jgi:hypothetical protein
MFGLFKRTVTAQKPAEESKTPENHQQRAEDLLRQVERMLTEAERRARRLSKTPAGPDKDAERRSLENTQVHLRERMGSLQAVIDSSKMHALISRINAVSESLVKSLDHREGRK